MSDEVDKTAGHLRVLIEKVRVFGDCVKEKKHDEAEGAFMLMQTTANEAEAYLNRPAD